MTAFGWRLLAAILFVWSVQPSAGMSLAMRDVAVVAQPVRCPEIEAVGGDVASAMRRCLDRLPPGAILALPPKIYHLSRPLTINRPITILSAGLATSAAQCLPTVNSQCATFLLEPMADVVAAGQMPIEITAPDVTFSHLRIVGSGGRDINYDRRMCLNDATRPSGGGIRVRAARFTFSRSILFGLTCYTGMEVTAGSDGLKVEDSVIGPNGDHNPGSIWSDGLTIHDVLAAKVVRNRFYDNTDVQLIFGGCGKCVIAYNVFRHSGDFRSSSYAELMLQSWPNTSGDFTGSIIVGNDIDCTAKRRCGYGIMIGSNPWYQGKAFGGLVAKNRVRRAMIGMNVDELTGSMAIRGNVIKDSGGRFPSSCGTKTWPSVNVAGPSRKFLTDVAAMEAGQVGTAGCMMNQYPS